MDYHTPNADRDGDEDCTTDDLLQRAEGGDLFYSLQVEETMESLNLSSNSERHRLELQIEGGNDEGWERGVGEGQGIIFSPGGNEALFLPGAQHQSTEPNIPSQRDVLMERNMGARPKTVGQSYDQAGAGLARREEDLDSTGIGPSPRSSGCLTDRALSPSQASVTSLMSGASNMSNSGMRRALEWDYSEDLGLDGAQSQDQAAASLSTLEKLAIGSYTEFLQREEPEGGYPVSNIPSLPQADQEEMIQGRMNKFADSLMRQRELQEKAKQQRRRSVPKEVTNKPTPGARMQTLGSLELPQEEVSAERAIEKNIISPVKFSSMTDIRMPPSPVKVSSWVGTPSSPQSLPSHLQDLVVSRSPPEPPYHPGLPLGPPLIQNRTRSRDSLSLSRTSPGNSVETVVSAHKMEKEDTTVHREEYLLTSREGTPLSSYSDSIGPPYHAWGEERSEPVQTHMAGRIGLERLQSSEPSSVPSTSDSDPGADVRHRGAPGRGDDSSTMESAKLIHRAKSFEYIPGSSFPLQENSSSYEYLPGHLVPDIRPPTVLTRPTSPRIENVNVVVANDDMDHVSAQLKEKSKELLTANLQQTRQFFSKLKRYIEFLATPSLTVEDSRRKQELADRISTLLTTEERRLGSSQSSLMTQGAPGKDSSMDRSSGSSSRLSGWRQARTRSEEQGRPASIAESRRHPGQEYSRPPNNAQQNIGMQPTVRMPGVGQQQSPVQHQDGFEQHKLQKLLRRRLAHMANIRREMKRLEKLDCMLIGTEKSAMLGSVSEMSVTTVSTMASETTVSTPATDTDTTGDRRTDLPPRIRSSRNNRQPRPLDMNRIKVAQTIHTDRQKTSQPTDSSREISRSIETSHPIELEEEISWKEMDKENTAPRHLHSKLNFSQMFPSDVEPVSGMETVTRTITNTSISLHSVHIQTETLDSDRNRRTRSSSSRPREKSKKKKTKNTKPVSYYLPMDTLSPIRIGRKLLGGGEGFLASEERDIICNYMASLSVSPCRPSTAPTPITKKPQGPKISLQEALLSRRRDFVNNCEARITAMRRAKEARMIRREKHTAWLDDIATQSPRTRRMAQPCYSPVTIPKVFSHKSMVLTSKHKYAGLPEVVNKKQEIKKYSRYQTNRVMAEIYSSHLQRKVVRGQVSLSHHTHVV